MQIQTIQEILEVIMEVEMIVEEMTTGIMIVMDAMIIMQKDKSLTIIKIHLNLHHHID